jgi:hypothetical protein
VDLHPPDGPPDHRRPDLPRPDLQAPDVAPVDVGPVSCGAQYGHVAGYVFCEETATTCRFYFQVSQTVSCNALCASGGGTCDAQDDNSHPVCKVLVGSECWKRLFDGICTCRR